MKKKISLLLAVIMMVSAICMTSAAADSRNLDKMTGYELTSNVLLVKYNGEAVTFPDAQPFIDSNSRTLIPVKFVAETMGANVSWDSANNTAVIEQKGVTIRVPIGNDTITVTKNNATSSVKMDTVAVNKYDRTYVPIRYVAESLGAWVGFASKYATVQIYKDVLAPEEITRLHGYYDMTTSEFCEAKNYSNYYTDEQLAMVMPMRAYCDGVGGFENANEAKLRNPKGIYSLKDGSTPTTFTGIKSGLTYKFGTQDDVSFSKLVLAEAVKGVESDINAKEKITVALKSDLSCVYWSRHSGNEATYIRGVLTVTIPVSADMSYIKQNYDFISNPISGETRNVDVEVRVDTFGQNVYWEEMTELKK